MEFAHKSVLLQECIDMLDIDPEGIYVDGTLGGAGHSLEICKKLKGGKLIAFDQDEDAIVNAKEKLKEHLDKVIFVHDNFSRLKKTLQNIEIYSINGILLDLGVSSYQLDNPERGFSYMKDAPLDMRMDRRAELTAFHVANQYSKEELVRILRDYGEEKWAARIADFIVTRRAEKPIETTEELVDVVKAAIPKKAREEKQHPAKRTFQAIRIEVNGELEIIRDTLESGIDLLAPGGVMAVITFHSLEDRIVKNCFREEAKDCICPPQLPICRCGHSSRVELINRKPILPCEEELNENPRSRSAKLRGVRKKETHLIEKEC